MFMLLTAVFSGLLAMGPHLKLGTWQPWWTLSEMCPGMEQVRNVFRFAYLTQMAVILLAISGLSELKVWLTAVTKKKSTVTLCLVIVGLLAVAEIPAAKPLLAGVPILERNRNWTDFIKNNTPAGKGIVCLPFSAGVRAADFDSTTRWMYYGTLHGIPMVNGYSGFFPEHYMRLRQNITDNGLNDSILTELAETNIKFIVARKSYKMPNNMQRLKLVYQDSIGIDVHELSDRK